MKIIKLHILIDFNMQILHNMFVEGVQNEKS